HEHVLKPLVTYHLPRPYVDACGYVRLGDQCCGRAVEHRKPWIVSDMLTDPLFVSARDAAAVSPIRAGFSVPVMTDSRDCIGSLGCHYTEPYTPGEQQIKANETWALMIADVISQYQKQSADGDVLSDLYS